MEIYSNQINQKNVLMKILKYVVLYFPKRLSIGLYKL